MIDSQSLASTVVYTKLNTTAAVTALADVWQNAPEDTQPGTKGLVIIGLVAVQNSEDKAGGLDQATVEIYTYVRQPDARKLYALNSAVRNALEFQTIDANVRDVVFLSASPSMMEDGETYYDSLRFQMWVQA